MSLVIHVSWSQEHKFYFNHIDQRQGLSQTTNQFIFKDSRGFIWISTQNGGLNRYDGQEVKAYKHNPSNPRSLPDNYIQSGIVEDNEHNLWFSTYTALVCYIRKYDHFINFQKKLHNSVITGYHLAFSDRQGRLGVIVGGNELYLYTPKENEWQLLQIFPSHMYRVQPHFNLDSSLKSLFAYNKDKEGLHVYSDISTGQASYSHRFLGNNEEQSFKVLSILPESDSIFLMTTTKGLFDFEVNNPDFKPNLLYEADEEDIPNQVALYGSDKLLMSFSNSGWKMIDRNAPNSVIKDYYHVPDNHWSLASNAAQGIWIDAQGVIWSGVNGVGVDFTQPQKVKFGYKDVSALWGKPKLPKRVFALAEDDLGNIWYSNRGNGVFKVSASFQPLEHFSYSDSLGKTIISDDIHYLLVDSKDRCWAFTFTGGLGLHEPGSKDFHSILENHTFIHGIESKEESLIFSLLAGGLCEINKQGSAVNMEMISTVSRKYTFTRLFQNSSGMIFGARGLTHIDVMDAAQNFLLIEDLPITGDIFSFYEDTCKNEMWIGTSNGLVHLSQSDWQFKTYNEATGLPDQTIYAVIGNNDGSLWLSTNKGIIQFFPEEHRFHAFDVPDGLQGLEFNTNSFLRLSNGKLLFGGQNGVNFFHPDSLNFVLSPPQVQFTNLEIEDGEVKVPNCLNTGASNITEIQKLKLGYNENTLKFEFAALEFSNPEKNIFKFKMDGMDNDWVDGGTKGEARYPNIPSGSYTFWVKAANSDGIWSKAVKMVVIIETPFWQTWWFFLICVFIIFSIIYTIYKNKLNQYLRIIQISNDLHDDIGSAFGHVKILIELIRKSMPVNLPALDLLHKIEEVTNSGAEALDDIVANTNPKNETLDQILSRMRLFATDVFEARGIEGVLDFPDDSSRVRLVMEKHRQFYLFFKEAVNNMAKYSSCKKARITVKYDKKNIFLSVFDDGVGFDLKEKEGAGNGIRTMKDRTEKLGGVIDIQTSLGEGTIVYLSFPYGRKLRLISRFKLMNISNVNNFFSSKNQNVK